VQVAEAGKKEAAKFFGSYFSVDFIKPYFNVRAIIF
jgi:hypothetical protein